MINPNAESGSGNLESIHYEPNVGFLVIKHQQPISELNLSQNLASLFEGRNGLATAISNLNTDNVRTLEPPNPPTYKALTNNVRKLSFVPLYGNNVYAELLDLDQHLIDDEDAGFIGDGLFQVVGSTPNWAMGGAQSWVGGGGPGAYPVKTTAPSTSPTFNPVSDSVFDSVWDTWMTYARNAASTAGVSDKVQRGNKRQRPRELVEEAKLNWEFLKSVLGTEGTETPVEIIVLDTVPPQSQLDAAAANWGQSTDPEYAPYKELLVDGLLTKQYCTVPLPPTDPNVHFWMLPGHDYNMSDHGFFVAGIAHSIAQNIPIHLIEVLNEKGVGTLNSLIWGFEQAIARILTVRATAPDTRFIINCSLTLSMPNTENEKKRSNHDFDQAMRAIESILESVQPHLEAASDVIVVAAAGNEGTNPDPNIRPPARYPAALDSVVGVGALDRNNSPTIYTNFSDTFANPSVNMTEQGIAIFGGNVLSTMKTDAHGLDGYISDPQDGVLGLYTHGTVYDTSANAWGTNTSGYARWSGTSFAAPAITGVLAQLIAHGLSPQEALNFLYDIHPGPLPGAEHLLTPLMQS